MPNAKPAPRRISKTRKPVRSVKAPGKTVKTAPRASAPKPRAGDTHLLLSGRGTSLVLNAMCEYRSRYAKPSPEDANVISAVISELSA